MDDYRLVKQNFREPTGEGDSLVEQHWSRRISSVEEDFFILSSNELFHKLSLQSVVLYDQISSSDIQSSAF